MNVYSAHVREHPAKLVLVRDGFSLWAAVFGPLWALALGLWESAVIIFVFQLAVGFAIDAFLGTNAAAVAQLGVVALIGVVAGELRRWNLARRGFVEEDSVLGTDAADAERRFLENTPGIIPRLEAGI